MVDSNSKEAGTGALTRHSLPEKMTKEGDILQCDKVTWTERCLHAYHTIPYHTIPYQYIVHAQPYRPSDLLAALFGQMQCQLEQSIGQY